MSDNHLTTTAARFDCLCLADDHTFLELKAPVNMLEIEADRVEENTKRFRAQVRGNDILHVHQTASVGHWKVLVFY
jgi:hypothetical protein